MLAPATPAAFESRDDGKCCPAPRTCQQCRAMQETIRCAARCGARRGSTAEVFAAFLRLGLTSFGGPIAHLGYFHEEFVVRRQWLDEKTYVDLVALSQFLPGPASSKVGIALGLSRAGYLGALAAWTGFTLPSAIALVLFAYGVSVARRRARQRLAAWAQGRRRRGGRPGGAGDDARRLRRIARARRSRSRPPSWFWRCRRRGARSAPSCSAPSSGLALFRGAPPADHASLPHPVSRTVAIAAIVCSSRS